MRIPLFFGIICIHLILVIFNMIVYSYEQTGDSQRYIIAARELTSFTFNFDPTVNCYTAPGYPLFLALTSIITQYNKFGIAIIQSLLFCSAIFYLLTELNKKGIVSQSLINISCFLVLLCPEIFESNGWTLSESFCGSMVLFIVGSIIDGSKHKYSQLTLLISTSFLIITKFEYILILPILLISLSYFKNKKTLFILIFCVSSILGVNGLKNYFIYNQFYLFSYSGGSVIYGGNNLNGDGSWHITDKNLNYLPNDQIDRYKQISELDKISACLEQDKFYKELAKDAWKKDWVNQVSILPTKFGKLWFIPGNMDFYTGQSDYIGGLQIFSLFDENIYPWYAKYKHAFYLGVYWLYLLAILGGFFLKIKRYSFNHFDFIVISLFGFVTLLYGIFLYGLGRFHIPIFGLLVIYSAFLIESWINKKSQ